MHTHEDAIDLATIALDFPISDGERAALDAHLAGCPDCRLEVAAIRRDALRLQSLEPIAPPAWVARAIGRRRRSITTLLLAAALAVGGTIGAATIVGSVLDRMTAVLPTSTVPALDATPSAPLLAFSPLPRITGWSPGRDMGAQRAMHTATRLADGTVLIAGGRSTAGELDSAELYVPATDSFRPVAPMNQRRSSATATLLPDGRVLVAGGGDFTSEIYDPVLDSWTETGRMIMRRQSHAAVLLPDGRVLVVGGTSGAGSTATAEIFDAASNTWELVGQMARGRASLTATLLPNGMVLVAGGEPLPGSGDAVNEVDLFDPATATFVAAQPLLDARSRHTATLLLDGRVLVVSGVQGPSVLTSVELYDPAAAAWARGPDVTEPREAFTITLLPDGRVLIIGGYSQGSTSSELRDATTGTWSSAGDTSEIRGYHSATQLLDGRVLVAGGINGSEETVASTELWLAAP
jgi:hypothetical protein